MNRTKARCPRCKSINLSITEHCINTQTWEQKDGLVNKEDGILNPGEVIGTFGQCEECSHVWKFRCLQITNLFIDNKQVATCV